MKNSRLFILLAGCMLGLLAVCWSRAQTASQRLKVLDDKGVEVHTLMGDQLNVVIDHLEATGQTNALEMFRQYRCAYGASLCTSELRDIVTVLQQLHEGRTNDAVRLLEHHLGFYASIMCNSYGCLNQTNRERVDVESLQRARDYLARIPPPERSESLVTSMNEVLRLSRETRKK